MRLALAIAVICASLVGTLPGHAEKRVALVVGNDRYDNLAANEQLQKAVNDAHAVGAALRTIGFDVLTGENLDRRAMLGKFDELVQRLEPGDAAFFFFAGHGVALDNVNYILPADVPDITAGQETRLKREALDEPYIVGELTGRGVRVAVVMLDACRNNPFSRSGRSVGVARGLAPPPEVSGVFSLYAASAGQEALDRLYDGDPNPNSVFSRVLAPMLKKPGLDLTDLARNVRDEVVRIASRAGHAQRPAYYDETAGGRFYLAGPGPNGGQAAVPPPGADAAQTWRDIQNTSSIAVIDAYIQHFGTAPVYGEMAQARRDELARGQGAPLTAAQERGLKPKDSFRECENCPEMVVVPAGSFTMGSPAGEKDRMPREGPQHAVTIGKLFAVGKLHVTVGQFAVFERETGHEASSKCFSLESGKWEMRPDRSWRNPGFEQDESHPVVCVTWDDARAYADWIAKKTRKPYRLLSEAEFEYAARGRTSPGAYPQFWFGNEEKDFCLNGNGADQKVKSIEGTTGWPIVPCSDGYAYTSPAGHYAPNAFGLYDMAGNAWQFMEDCWHEDYNGAPNDGSAWTSTCGRGHVVRGGSWGYNPGFLRAAGRTGVPDVNYNVGFRLARTLTP